MVEMTVRDNPGAGAEVEKKKKMVVRDQLSKKKWCFEIKKEQAAQDGVFCLSRPSNFAVYLGVV